MELMEIFFPATSFPNSLQNLLVPTNLLGTFPSDQLDRNIFIDGNVLESSP